MRLVHLTKTVVVAFLCHLIAHGAEMPNERNNPEGVDFDDNYEIEVTHEGNVVDSTAIEKGHHATITVTVSAFCNKFTIDLRLNSFLFSADYTEISFNEHGAVHHHVDQKKKNCFYLGEVRNEEYSSAAISTCKGIDGFFAVGNISYHIESQSDRFSGPHKVYKARNDTKTTYKCGHDEVPLRTLLNPLRHARRLKRSFIWPQDVKMNKIVELYVVADFSEYQSQGNSVPATTKRITDIVNIANAGYQPIGIYLMLVGIEVWNVTDQILVDANNRSATLAAFADYRRQTINPTTYNDDGVLVTNKTFEGNALGYAYVGQMCSNRFAAALVSDSHMPAVAGAIMDHEIGHNFGLIHDDAYTAGPCPCTDPTTKCIMYSAPSSSAPGTTWSQCSLTQFDTAFKEGADLCLHNVPTAAASTTGSCGNGIVESGEQCDCGNSSSQQCNRACCDATTCQLIAPAACAFGRCCDISKCQILPAGTSCRAKADSCDLEEFCDGAAPLCANDTYVPDGTACTVTGAPAYCYKGLCRNRESQCELLWGPGTKVSIDRCYIELNPRGYYRGNCGIDKWVPVVNYSKCDLSDVKCGLLQCEDVTRTLYTYKYAMNTSQNTYPNGSTCHNVLFDFGTAVQNPGLVPDGASCGDGQMCISQKCVNVSNVLVASCSSCLSGQACNNLGQCQDITQTIRPTTTATFTTTAIPSSAVVTSTILLSESSSTTSTTTSTTSTTTSTTSTTTSTTSTTTSSSTVSTPSTTVQSEAKVISLSLGIALGAVGAAVATSLCLIGLCFPGFFPFLFKACSPWTPAKSTEEFPDEPLDDMLWPAGPIPMPSRMHWSPAGNYFNAPPPTAAPFENPAEFYYPQNAPNWDAMRRVMPFWRNENDYRYKLFPGRISNFSPEGV